MAPRQPQRAGRRRRRLSPAREPPPLIPRCGDRELSLRPPRALLGSVRTPPSRPARSCPPAPRRGARQGTRRCRAAASARGRSSTRGPLPVALGPLPTVAPQDGQTFSCALLLSRSPGLAAWERCPAPR